MIDWTNIKNKLNESQHSLTLWMNSCIQAFGIPLYERFTMFYHDLQDTTAIKNLKEFNMPHFCNFYLSGLTLAACFYMSETLGVFSVQPQCVFPSGQWKYLRYKSINLCRKSGTAIAKLQAGLPGLTPTLHTCFPSCPRSLMGSLTSF